MVMTVRDLTPAQRFWPRVDKTDTCWLWTGYIKANGYATFYPGGGRHVAKVYVHRWVYEALRGEIPDGFEVDHLCNVRHCVNPAHLEAVTKRENLDRRNETNGWERLPIRNLPRPPRTHCKREHALDDENTYRHAGYRYCKTCRREASQRRYERVRAA